MTSFEEEQQALTEFIFARPKGNLLRQIAESRLEEIIKEYSRYTGEWVLRNTSYGSIPVKNIETGRMFPSIAAAALSINIDKSTLCDDLMKNKPNHPFRKLHELV